MDDRKARRNKRAAGRHRTVIVALLAAGVPSILRCAADNQSEPGAQPAFDEHDWKVESSAMEFTRPRQQLVYYVAGLSSALLAYLGTLVDGVQQSDAKWPFGAAAIAGVICVGSAVWSLRQQHRSIRLNLRYSAQRRRYAALTPAEQADWDRVNQGASWALTLAMIALAGQFTMVACSVWTSIR